jgi:Phosphate transporter family
VPRPAGAATLFTATFLGVPVSTTHTITGAIVGVGAARRVSAVRWNVASSIVYAWVITIPASAVVAALTWWAVHFFSLARGPMKGPQTFCGPLLSSYAGCSPLAAGGSATGSAGASASVIGVTALARALRQSGLG